MKAVRELAEVGLGDRAEVGSKAAVLGALLSAGLPVPGGFVVLDPSSSWRGIRPRTALIARSSAPVEDGLAASFAGQFESIGGLRSTRALLAAVRRVSRPGSRARAYAQRLGLGLPDRIPVLVQAQVPVARAGVLFTVDPLGRRPGTFGLGWGKGTAVADGGTGRFLAFDPMTVEATAVPDVVVARALPQLVDHAFAALAAVSRSTPLDLEWVVDRAGKLWIVQARPVTALRRCGNATVQKLVSEGWLLVSPRPASRLAQSHYLVAAEVDRRAARYHHAHFERRIEGGWLLARRVKTASRAKLDGETSLGFAARFAWRRRRNLAFGLEHLARFLLVSRSAERWASRLLASDLRRSSERALQRDLAGALRTYDRVRRVHAALWYPVDLADDLESFERLFDSASRPLTRPRRRSARDRQAAELTLRIRRVHGDANPRWSELAPAERALVLRHLSCHPYAFGEAAEVQDLSAWSSWVEQPERWWAQQAGVPGDELSRLARPPVPAIRQVRGPLVGEALRALVSPFAPLKDDRVELLALTAAALRFVLVEVERRAGTRDGDHGWIFELEPRELLSLREDPRLRSLALARMRERVLAGFCDPTPAPTGLAPPLAEGDLVGTALSGGLATGLARVVHNADEARRLLRPGEVLVAEEVRPAFTAVLPRACALVCRRGTPLSHAAIVARELSIPAVSFEEVSRIHDGARLQVDGDHGRLRLVSVPAETIATRSPS